MATQGRGSILAAGYKIRKIAGMRGLILLTFDDVTQARLGVGGFHEREGAPQVRERHCVIYIAIDDEPMQVLRVEHGRGNEVLSCLGVHQEVEGRPDGESEPLQVGEQMSTTRPNQSLRAFLPGTGCIQWHIPSA